MSITFRNESIHFLASVPNGAIPNSISTIVAVLSSFKILLQISSVKVLQQCKQNPTMSSYVVCHLGYSPGSTGISPNVFNIID